MFKCYTQLPFVDERAKVNALCHQAAAKSNQRLQASHVGQLHLSPRWRTCSHNSSLPMTIKNKCRGFVGKNEWPLNSSDLNLLDYHGSRHLSLKRLNCWRKSCAKFDSLFLNIQEATACSLEKLLYLLNHICYFNKICRICGLNPHL